MLLLLCNAYVLVGVDVSTLQLGNIVCVFSLALSFSRPYLFIFIRTAYFYLQWMEQKMQIDEKWEQTETARRRKRDQSNLWCFVFVFFLKRVRTNMNDFILISNPSKLIHRTNCTHHAFSEEWTDCSWAVSHFLGLSPSLLHSFGPFSTKKRNYLIDFILVSIQFRLYNNEHHTQPHLLILNSKKFQSRKIPSVCAKKNGWNEN